MIRREVLFKGKRADNGEWVYGSLILHGSAAYILPEDCVTPFGILKTRVKPETIGQFTGELDRDKTRIFEGDLFRLGAEKQIFEVRFHAGCFLAYVGNKQWGLVGELKMCFIKVIGNIHDNAELI